MIDIARLREVSLLASLRDSDLAVLAKNLRPLRFEAGESLVTEGMTTCGPLMIILDGQVEVSRKDAGGTPRTLAMLEGPTVIGEMEFLADVEATATVVVHDEVSGFVLARERFEELLNADEPAAFHLARAIGRIVSERLAETDRSLAKVMGRR
jgi:CRP/FNR family transcriptional regulator, cyclic AMP receptor protein